MGLRQTIAQWIATIKDTLDFGPEFSAALTEHRVKFTEELERLQHLLEEARKAAREKDELIAKLQTTAAVRGNVIVDGSAYYLKKETTLDGPFCTSCFQRRHEITRIVPAPQPQGTDGDAREWVQCLKCQTPFRSERMAQFLDPQHTAAPGTLSSAAAQEAEPLPGARKPRSRARSPRGQSTEATRAPARRRAVPGDTTL